MTCLCSSPSRPRCVPEGRALSGSAVVRQYEKRRITDSLLQSKALEGLTPDAASDLVNRAQILFFDGGAKVLQQVKRALTQRHWIRPPHVHPHHCFFCFCGWRRCEQFGRARKL